jgi:hypothetical protein
MFNVIDINPLRALAKRASERIGDPNVAQRFEKIALDQLLKDPRNFRQALAHDIDKAPQWARDAHQRGEELSVYRANGALAARLHTVARRIADALRVSQTAEEKRLDDALTIAEAREFIAKFGRVNFDTAARKSVAFSRVLARWQEEDDAKRLCDAQTLVLLGGLIWYRISSVAELRRVGQEFRNCLARTTRSSAYGGQLAQGRAQFWVLRDVWGRGRIVAMAPAPQATHFLEVKGPNNKPIPSDDPSLVQLGLMIGVRPRAPEPPPPPPSGPAGLAATLAALAQPCRCTLCNPLSSRAFRLRRSGGAP